MAYARRHGPAGRRLLHSRCSRLFGTIRHKRQFGWGSALALDWYLGTRLQRMRTGGRLPFALRRYSLGGKRHPKRSTETGTATPHAQLHANRRQSSCAGRRLVGRHAPTS